jgi:hypothetical protein
MLAELLKIEGNSIKKTIEQRFECAVVQTELLDLGALKNAPPEQLSLFERGAMRISHEPRYRRNVQKSVAIV